MRFYARPSARLVRQIVSDVFMVTWAVGWWFVGRFVDGVLRAVAEPARQTAALGDRAADQLDEIARQAGGVPLVGDGLSRPFTDLAGSVNGWSPRRTSRWRPSRPRRPSRAGSRSACPFSSCCWRGSPAGSRSQRERARYSSSCR